MDDDTGRGVKLNAKEQDVAAALRSEGWVVYSSGWPDFLVTRVVDGKREVVAVEVKGNRFDKPRENQSVILALLSEVMPTIVAHCEPASGKLPPRIDIRTIKGVLAGCINGC